MLGFLTKKRPAAFGLPLLDALDGKVGCFGRFRCERTEKDVMVCFLDCFDSYISEGRVGMVYHRKGKIRLKAIIVPPRSRWANGEGWLVR